MLTAGPSSFTNSYSFIEQIQASIPVPVRWKDGKHIASRLLTPAENTKVFKILGSKRKVWASNSFFSFVVLIFKIINACTDFWTCTGTTWNERKLMVECFVGRKEKLKIVVSEFSRF